MNGKAAKRLRKNLFASAILSLTEEGKKEAQEKGITLPAWLYRRVKRAYKRNEIGLNLRYTR